MALHTPKSPQSAMRAYEAATKQAQPEGKVKLTPRAWRLAALGAGLALVSVFGPKALHAAEGDNVDPATSFYQDVNQHPENYEQVGTINGKGINKLAQTLAPGADEHTTNLEDVLKFQRDANGNLQEGYVIVPRADVEVQPASAQDIVPPVAPPKG